MDRFIAPGSTSGHSAPKSSSNTTLGEYQQAKRKISCKKSCSARNFRLGWPSFAHATSSGSMPCTPSSASTRRHKVVFPVPVVPITAVAPVTAKPGTHGPKSSKPRPLPRRAAALSALGWQPSCVSRRWRRDAAASAKSARPSNGVELSLSATSRRTSCRPSSGGLWRPGTAVQSVSSGSACGSTLAEASAAWWPPDGQAGATFRPLLSAGTVSRTNGGVHALRRSSRAAPRAKLTRTGMLSGRRARGGDAAGIRLCPEPGLAVTSQGAGNEGSSSSPRSTS
mmetsp:Transcript_14446/g.45506  ORF Transcript_14446/g.45506 Transcript_14446/m.45506 type:complete len:282 (-) Transcript_14446:1575-2420(-)